MLECKQRHLQNRKKVSSKMKSNCHGPQDQYPQGVCRGKRTYFKKEMREEKKNTLCLYMSAN